MLNARASFNRLIKSIADVGIQIVLEPHEAEKLTCYKVEWLSAEVPRGANRYARNVRVHLKGGNSGDASPREGTYEIEKRMERLIAGLKLGNQATIASHPLYDYATNATTPALIGAFTIRRSVLGVEIKTPPPADPGRRHLVLTLVLTYQR